MFPCNTSTPNRPTHATRFRASSPGLTLIRRDQVYELASRTRRFSLACSVHLFKFNLLNRYFPMLSVFSQGSKGPSCILRPFCNRVSEFASPSCDPGSPRTRSTSRLRRRSAKVLKCSKRLKNKLRAWVCVFLFRLPFPGWFLEEKDPIWGFTYLDTHASVFRDVIIDGPRTMFDT